MTVIDIENTLKDYGVDGIGRNVAINGQEYLSIIINDLYEYNGFPREFAGLRVVIDNDLDNGVIEIR